MPHYRGRITAIFFLLLACNDRQQEANAPEKSTVDSLKETQVEITSASAACYVSAESQNRIEMQLNFRDDSVTGTMNYQIAGKDKNMGKLRGTKEVTAFLQNIHFIPKAKNRFAT